ncbi:hypothetical protein IV500_04690 [Paeniglutamicibacter antarcticus]|uniref:PAS domain-containing protein n=1 Tax=Arthrobacter terrae TaxID=2935737 RepID=A0A931G4R8_9MICC|nr:hypothetical protein [Arthrobacter terrae]MBG0738715.1 hypothetical protein [Arthrobacter terrae]
MNTVTDTRSKWVLVDYLDKDQSGLLSIGEVNFHGASVRKNLDAHGRELLVDRIRAVEDTGIGIDEVVERRKEKFRVLAEPILSPSSRGIVAVRAIYVPVGEPVPSRPVTGALEWVIWDDGRIETVWDDDMFTIYEISRTGSASPTGDMNQWVNSLIAPEDRARMKLTIDTGIKESNGRRYFVHYRIVTRKGTTDTGVKNLEVSSSSNPDPVLPLRRLRALTREVPELIPAINPEFGDTGNLMRAVFDLSTDAVLLAVDVRRWQTFMTSNSWAAFGIQTPQYGYLPHVIHPDDFEEFRYAVTTVTQEPVTIRFLHSSGGFHPYEVTVSSGPSVAEDPEYVICRMKPAVVAVL